MLMNKLGLALAGSVLLLGLPVLAQEDNAPDPLMELLDYVPDTIANRQLFMYGDQQAWLESWGFKPIPDLETLEQLRSSEDEADNGRAAAWMLTQFYQAPFSPDLGIDNALETGMRSTFGFDIFMVQQSLFTGSAPDDITVARFNDTAAMDAALTATGYTAAPISGGTLYSLREDNEAEPGWDFRDLAASPAVNRIAVMEDGTTLIGNNTAVIEGAVDARGEGRSLADNHAVLSLLEALNGEATADYGSLTGLLMVDALDLMHQPMSPALIAPGLTEEERDAILAQREAYFETYPLPGYTLAGFSTHHSAGRSYNTLALVLLEGRDPQAAAEVLRQRMEVYTLYYNRRDFPTFLEERGMVFEAVVGVETEHFPVAMVVLSHPDPSLRMSDEGMLSMIEAWAFRWTDMIYNRDLGFLALE